MGDMVWKPGDRILLPHRAVSDKITQNNKIMEAPIQEGKKNSLVPGK